MGKSKVLIYNVLLFIILFPIFDIAASNFFLKIDGAACYKFETHYYELKKNCSGNFKFKSAFPTVKVYTDNYGLRTGKKRIKKSTDSNVLVFGDSMTYGVGLKYENTIVGILDNKIDNYNFYNFAMGSYSPTVHLYKFQQAIKMNLLPEKVILLLDLSDIYDEGARWSSDGASKPQLKSDFLYQLSKKKKKFTHKNFQVTRFITSTVNSNLRVLRNRIKNLGEPIERDSKVKTSIQGSYTYVEFENIDKTYWNEEIFSSGIKKVKERILEISNLAKENGSEFYLLIYPWGETLIRGQEAFNWEDFSEEICANDTCNLINTFPNFVDKKNNDKFWYSNLYFVGDEHFNKKGNQFLADIIENKVF